MGESAITFRAHSELFIELVLKHHNLNSVDAAPSLCAHPAYALRPVIIDDYRALSAQNKADLSAGYNSIYGVATFIVRNADEKPSQSHPLFDLVSQLDGVLPVAYPLTHPLEGHPEAVRRFGPPDGTVKIYNLPKSPSEGYREQAETNEMFDMHHDGLGSGGTVQTVVLYMDSPPLYGGFTYFQNIPLLGLALARDDMQAFQSLFSPQSLTIIRPRGKGAIKVTTPVLFVNDIGRAQSFFRVPSGEYSVAWENEESLARARTFLERFIVPFGPASSFVHFSARGHGCFINNQVAAHARTGFRDDMQRGLTRVLSRKWFMRSARDSKYKHVPGMFVAERFAPLYQSVCNEALLEGEWLYDGERDVNTRIE
jgi:hypothetical protein